MKRIRYVIASFAALVISAGSVAAQDNYLGGVLLSGYEFSIFDMLSLSQHNTSFTTARASAMGGAFTSLGGDLSSMSINPAGIAMYRGGAWGFTPAMNFSGSKNPFTGGRSDSNRFSFNNIGIVSQVYYGSGALTSVNLGFSYNKLADFNKSYNVEPFSGDYSILDIFSAQLNGLSSGMYGDWSSGRRTNTMLNNNPFYNNSIGLNEWGALLGYQTGAVSPVNSSDSNNLFDVSGLTLDAKILPGMYIKDRGSVGEYNFTAGMNFRDKLYLGVGISIQDIYMLRNIYYDESYDRNADGDLRSMQYDQTARMSGAGFNFKVGVTYRPIPALRIGLAVHSPTWTSVTHEYSAVMRVENNTNSALITRQTPTNTWDISYRSPTRLMAGVSYTLGSFAAFAVDYERVWYNGIRLSSGEYWDKENYKADVQSIFLPGNNIKVGVEVKPVPAIALRAGYSYYSSPLEEGYRYTKPVVTETNNISAGIGFRIGPRSTLDLAYVYSMNKYCDFDLYYYAGELRRYDGNIVNTGDAETGYPITTVNGGERNSPITGMRLNRHTAIMSFGFLF